VVVELMSSLSDDEVDASAVLTAAAPVLLEACRHARQFIGDAVLKDYLAPQPGTPEAQALVDAAIAKAEHLTWKIQDMGARERPGTDKRKP
jgi:hypothetical protein